MIESSIKKGKILFIDDDAICHTLAELIINNFTPYKMIGAFTVKEAMVLVKKHSENLKLILSDIMLPDQSGYEILVLLKKDTTLANIPIIFQSGLSIKEQEIENHIKEKVHILSKPYSQKELLNLIDKLIK